MSRLGRALRWAGVRLGLVVVGVAAALVVLEVALQAGAAYTAWTGRTAPTTWIGGARRVLALGDSNTYGVFVEPTQAYPLAFQQLWNQQPDTARVEVLNLGYPGANSSILRNRFGALLRTLRPDVVTVMVGVNDFWTAPEALAESTGGESWGQRLWRFSRAYRLLYITLRTLHKTDVALQLEEGPSNFQTGGALARVGDETLDLTWKHVAADPTWLTRWESGLEANLAALAAEATRSGARLVLLTYASNDPVYGRANNVIRRYAARSGTALVDVATIFAPRCPQWRCDELFPDQHPTVQGHRLAAEFLVERLRAENVLR